MFKVRKSASFETRKFLHWFLSQVQNTILHFISLCDHHFPINYSVDARGAMLSESENDEMPTGWPLGLGFLNVRVRVAESLPGPAAPQEPYSLHMPSTSFSSFSSSNLDTESTASFFQDNSVSLGRLIGIRPGERGRLYFPNSLRFDENEKKTLGKGSSSDDDDDDDATKVVQEMDVSRGICIPTLLDALMKVSSKSKRSSRN